MPEHRRDWAEAMRVEFHALPTDREALAWATGCVWASYCERIEPMQVFLTSLLRAVIEGLVVAAFILGLLYLPLLWGSKAYVGTLTSCRLRRFRGARRARLMRTLLIPPNNAGAAPFGF
jgi:hypothetical protein